MDVRTLWHTLPLPSRIPSTGVHACNPACKHSQSIWCPLYTTPSYHMALSFFSFFFLLGCCQPRRGGKNAQVRWTYSSKPSWTSTLCTDLFPWLYVCLLISISFSIQCVTVEIIQDVWCPHHGEARVLTDEVCHHCFTMCRWIRASVEGLRTLVSKFAEVLLASAFLPPTSPFLPYSLSAFFIKDCACPYSLHVTPHIYSLV